MKKTLFLCAISAVTFMEMMEMTAPSLVAPAHEDSSAPPSLYQQRKEGDKELSPVIEVEKGKKLKHSKGGVNAPTKKTSYR